MRPSRAKLAAAYAAIYLIWGSTYYAIRVGLETMGPSLLMGLRFLGGALGSALLALWLERGQPKGLTRTSLLNAALVGILLLIGGTGMVGYAEQTISSHLAACLIASMPLWIGCWDALWAGRWTMPPGRMAGTALGMGGVVLLMMAGRRETDLLPSRWEGLAFMGAALLCWSFGSSYSHARPMPSASLTNAALQMAVAGILLLAWGGWNGEVSVPALSGASARSWWAMAYLAVLGSTVAFTAFAWLLKVEPPTRVASYALVNPAVAVLLGAWLGHERVLPATWAGLAFVLAGLALHLGGWRGLKPATTRASHSGEGA